MEFEILALQNNVGALGVILIIYLELDWKEESVLFPSNSWKDYSGVLMFGNAFLTKIRCVKILKSAFLILKSAFILYNTSLIFENYF